MAALIIYPNFPQTPHDAWASLERVLDHLEGLFFLIATAANPDNETPDGERLDNVLFGTALVGYELAGEARERAEVLLRFAKCQGKEQKPDADTSREVTCGN